jgi:hypothetical protein
LIDVSIGFVHGGAVYYDTDNLDDTTLDNRVFGPDTYDRTASLEQFTSQRPLARHSLFQFEPTEDGTMPTWKELESSLLKSIENVSLFPLLSKIQLYDKPGVIGDGALISIPLKGNDDDHLDNRSHISMVWDGRTHVDINLFVISAPTKDEDVAMMMNDFAVDFATQSGLTLSLRDDQPRGYGRVVNFHVDINNGLPFDDTILDE